ncbi:Rieske (2Fe-2S) protein [Bradyrhizobium sp. ma5]|uniref:Rieske (2Fe-2S) protein n=1 Tax=Bradyrhizobium sp. ma5 TaxID=3344828 RepID=UPI0035D47FD8
MDKTKALTDVVCRLSDLNDGRGYGFDPFKKGRDTVFVVRRGNEIHAYLDICPHYGRTPLPWKKDAYLTGDAQHIFCSAHGAIFDIETGACILGPCLGQSLTSVQVAISDEGEIRLVLRPDDNLISKPVVAN